MVQQLLVEQDCRQKHDTFESLCEKTTSAFDAAEPEFTWSCDSADKIRVGNCILDRVDYCFNHSFHDFGTEQINVEQVESFGTSHI